MPRTKASRSAAKEADQQFNSARAEAYQAACSMSMQRSMDAVNTPLSTESRNAVTETLLASANDPYGDGDQSPVPALGVRNPHEIVLQSDPLRTAWSTGLDLQISLLGDVETWFHRDCYEGEEDDVRTAIQRAQRKVEEGETDALTQLLEGRLSMLRLTPLHICCQGARFHGAQTSDAEMKYYKIAELLLESGARPDSRDICGYTPMATAAGFRSTHESLALVPLLKRFGADPNAITRFGEGLLGPTIMAGNVPAFRALIQVGADANMADRTGLTPRHMARSSQELLKEIVDGQRQSALKAMRCEDCGKEGARKYCSACKKAYYCSKDCQKKHWKEGHKLQCGKEQAEFVDIVVGVMTSRTTAGIKNPRFVNSITGVGSDQCMKKKDDKALVVKVTKPMDGMGLIKINQKNSDWLLVKTGDEYNRLAHIVTESGIEKSKVYLSAKWGEPKEVGGKIREVLRVDISKALPPPKPLW